MELADLMKSALNESINETMSTVFASQPTLIEGEPSKMHDYDLICSIGFAGNLEGNVVALFKKEDAIVVVSKMLDMEINEMSSDVVDGIGEILNMLAGGFKNRACKDTYHFDINIPTVINGHELNVAASAGVNVRRLMIYSENFAFGIILTYKVHQEGSEPSAFAARKAAIKSDALLKSLLPKDEKPAG